VKLLLIEPRKGDATSYYRSSGVLPYLRDHITDFHITSIPGGKELSWTDAAMYNVSLLQRPVHAIDVRNIRLLKECGVRVVLDYDDDLLNIDEGNPVYAHHFKNRENIIACLMLADVVIVSTEALMKSFKPYCSKIVVINNAHNDYLFPATKKPSFEYTKIAYYRGGSTHQRDVYTYAGDIVDAIKHHSDWRFYFLGDRFQFIEMNTQKCDNLFVSGYSPVYEFLRSLPRLRPCAYMSFLEVNPFNAAKSNCGWIEATYAGAASFVSKDLPEFDSVPGMRFRAHVPSFKGMFEMHASNENFLKGVHDASWEEVKKNYLLSDVNRKRALLLK
jgi:hypothetical protein